MSGNQFVYVTYIRTTPDKLWHALTNTDFMQQYWFGARPESDYRKGSPWKIVYPDGRLMDSGEIIESVPQKKLIIKWRNEWNEEMKADGWSRCTMELEAEGDSVKLSITHGFEDGGSAFLKGVSGGWPKIISNLKSLLETGTVLWARKEM